ncbi:hypothetical protein Sme01_40950 [Sphaerisporangium melleum]|uniref:Secreted protein n=1 Tax=Sphaerisporangium melleum TaxID=321316 RepID=A0A917RDM1_9ACTN|nr:hypothetical protein [Sphaerisporangium melleum]GGL00900.1 hypothetical protein GCM10007964_48750 [Sphaerisporangium melleum]GII71619.1 hypothetical protein Sme01_40950 [Sphaerisporangium melleum]
MRRSIRNILGLAAASAVIAVGVPALAGSASAATATTTSASADYDDYWGYYYSKYYNGSRAKAKGHVYEDEDGDFHVEGRVYDKNSPGWLCGYVQVKFENEDGDDSTYWAKKCGSSGSRYFHFSEEDVDNIQVRVCYWDNYKHAKKYCGRWNYIYEADGDE